MCGIAGIYHFNNASHVDERILTAMRDSLVHRGPDDAGLFVSKNKKVGLATRRLKIIDLSDAAHMPMSDQRKNTWITYNGEVYNFKEIRSELEKRGHRFHSQSDAEVTLHAYLEYGADCVTRLNGMFAFVIWDENKQLFFAARDHVGIKPFYYAFQNGTFYFGSEIKAILAHPQFKKELDISGVSKYLTFSSTPAPDTLFQNIKKLPAAHTLSIQTSGKVDITSYWSPFKNTETWKRATEQEYVDTIQSTLRDSIRAQMVSDVPFGCFLSGGVDSSTNAALMSEVLGKPVETFSVGIRGFTTNNEFEYSQRVAKMLGAKRHELLIDEANLIEFLDAYPKHADDPNGDPVCFPLFFLSKMTRENGVIVVQVGEGADELFAGYPLYLRALKLYTRWWRMLKATPSFKKKALYSIARKFPSPQFDFQKEYLRRLSFGQEPFWGLAVAFSDFQKNSLTTGSLHDTESSYKIVEQIYEEFNSSGDADDFLKKITYLELKHRLPEFLLARADKMTMAHSIEARVPFLDKRIVELAFSIPSAMKITNNEPKYLLKRAVRGIIPNEIIDRKKQGFWTPMNAWFKSSAPIAKTLHNELLASPLIKQGLINERYVRTIINAHQKSNADYSFQLWNILTLSRWYGYWF